MRFCSFLLISLKRLANQPGLTLVFIVAAVVAIGTVVSVPVFAGGVSRRIMQQELGLLTNHVNRPPFVVRFHASPSPRRPVDMAGVDYNREWLASMLVRYVGIPIDAVYTEIHSPRYDLMPRKDDPRYTEDVMDAVYVVCADRVENHIQVVAGTPFGQDADPDALAVWVHRSYADEVALEAGDTYEIGDVYSRQVNRIPIRIAGIWEARDPEDEYWWYTEQIWHYEGILLTSRQEYETHLFPDLPSKAKFVSWRFVLDDSRMNLARAQHYVDGLTQTKRDAARRLPSGAMDEAPTDHLVRGQKRKMALSLVLLGFSVPLLAIIIYFMGAVSAVAVRFQTQEVAMLISRGSGRLQVVTLSLLETAIIVALATPLGLVVGLGLARLLGYSLTFLRFVPRTPLEVHLASFDWRLCAGAMGVTILSRVIPTWSASKHTIVIQERQSARVQVALGATRFLLIGLLAGGTVYAYRQLALIGTLGLVSWEPGNLAHDPLLLLAPSLFLLTAPLILSEIFVLFMRPLAWIGKLLPSIAGYLGCMDLGREGGNYRTPVYMLTLCLSIGVFYASLAKSADAWLIDRRRYEVGSDLTFKPPVPEDDESSEGPLEQAVSYGEESPFHLPMSEYEKLEGIEGAMPVGEYEATLRIGRGFSYGRLLGIDRLRFPQIAYYRSDYSSHSLGELMNRLGSRFNGLLMPTDAATRLRLLEGERVRLEVLIEHDHRHPFEFVLVGTFDYFPTMFPQEGALFVANLAYLQMETAGLLPYGIWLRMAPDANSEEVAGEVVRHVQLALEAVGDLPRLLSEDQARLERVGVFGMLSVSFVAGAFLSALGLLVHSGASMRARTLRFAVLQALGLTRAKVMLTVLVEYALTLLYSISSGAAIGIIGARLYVPFFQLTEEGGVPIPPFIPLIDRERGLLIAAIMVIALLVVEGMVLLRLLKARVFEVLRMGMRE